MQDTVALREKTVEEQAFETPMHAQTQKINERKQTINNINTQHMDEIVLEKTYINNLKKCTPEVVWKELKETLEEYDDSWNINDDEPCETAHERRWIKFMIERY